MKTITLDKDTIKEKIAANFGSSMGHGWDYMLIISPDATHKISAVPASRCWNPWNKDDLIAPLPAPYGDGSSALNGGEANDPENEAPFGTRETEDGDLEHIECSFQFRYGYTGQIADYTGLEEPWAEMADDRVTSEKELSSYRDLLIDYDWPNQAEHWEWVATAPIKEIIAWAADIRANE